MRYLIALIATFALVLGACQADDGGSPTDTVDPSVDLFASPSDDDDTLEASPSESPEETVDADESESPDASFEESPDESMDEDGTDASPTESPDDDGLASGMSCQESFDEVPDLTRLDSLRDFRDAIDALDGTIEACDSVDEWTEQAQDGLDFANLDVDAEDFLRDRCEESDTLSDSPLCEEL